jgi:hypothetical protein
MKTKVFALAVALAMLAPNAHAATFNLPSGGSVYIAGLTDNPQGIPSMETITISIHVDAVPGLAPNPGYPFNNGGQFLPSYWDNLFLVKTGDPVFTPNSFQSALLGQCYNFCNGFLPRGGTSASFTFNIFDHPDMLRTLSWTTIAGSFYNMLSVTPHVTLSMRDGLTPVPVPLPAALPLFAGGLAAVVWFGRRRRAAPLLTDSSQTHRLVTTVPNTP